MIEKAAIRAEVEAEYKMAVQQNSREMAALKKTFSDKLKDAKSENEVIYNILLWGLNKYILNSNYYIYTYVCILSLKIKEKKKSLKNVRNSIIW